MAKHKRYTVTVTLGGGVPYVLKDFTSQGYQKFLADLTQNQGWLWESGGEIIWFPLHRITRVKITEDDNGTDSEA